MNKLERETENACLNVISKRKGRGAFVVVIEPDGVNPAGSNYCIHAETDTRAPEVLKVAIEEITKHCKRVIRLILTGKE